MARQPRKTQQAQPARRWTLNEIEWKSHPTSLHHPDGSASNQEKKLVTALAEFNPDTILPIGKAVKSFSDTLLGAPLLETEKEVALQIIDRDIIEKEQMVGSYMKQIVVSKF